jgi:hypothetical protein
LFEALITLISLGINYNIEYNVMWNQSICSWN